MKTESPALVLSLFDSSISIIRPLHKLGVKMIGVSISKGDVARASKFIEFHEGTDPYSDPKPLVSELLAIQKSVGKPIAIFSPNDKLTAFISANRGALAGPYLFNLPSHELMHTMNDKHTQIELVAKHGMKIPATFEFSATLNWDRKRLTDLRMPAFIKPMNIQNWVRQFHVKGFEVATRDDLNAKLDDLQKRGLDVLVQELIPGPLENMFEVSGYIDTKGELRGMITTQKTRIYPLDLGVGAAMFSTSNREVEEIAAKTLKSIGLRGYFNMELKRHDVTGAYEYIETNVRPWQQISLGHAAGVAFIEMGYRDVTGQEMPAFKQAVSGKTWMDPVLCYYSLVKDPRTTLLDWLKWFGELFSADALAVFTWSDLGPNWIKLKKGKDLIGFASQTAKFFVRRLTKLFRG